MIDVEKVRRWIVCFDCFSQLESLPVPTMIVGEVEKKGYRIPAYDVGIFPPESGGQLTVTLAGRGKLTANGRDYELRPGSAFLYRDRDRGVSYCTASDTAEPWEFVWINFKGIAAEKLIGEINERHGYFFDVGIDDELIRMLLFYRSFSGSTFSVSPLEGAGVVVELLRLLCRRADSGSETSGSGLVRRIQNELNASGDEPLSAAALARKMGVSREHLSKTFHEETGESFRDYRARRRLQEALTLLQKSNMSCKEIAARCHYGSYSSFFRAFRKKYQLSPEEFRSFGLPEFME